MHIDEIRTSHPLALWYALFARVSHYAHPSHVLPGIPELYTAMHGISGFSLSLHMYISRYWWQEKIPSLCEQTPEEIDPFIASLILCERNNIDRLALLLGALDYGPLLRSTIAKDQVQILRDALSTDIMHIVSNRHGGFYSGRVRQNSSISLKDIILSMPTLGYAMLVHMQVAIPTALQDCWKIRMPVDVDISQVKDMKPAWVLQLVRDLLKNFPL